MHENEMIVTENKTPIEIVLGIDGNGMTTARALYQFLELSQSQFSRWAKKNIEENEFFTEGTDWIGFDIVSNGNICKDYRISANFAEHLSMESHSEKGKQARNYFIAVENKVKKNVIDRSKLSMSTQIIYAMLDRQAEIELHQQEQDKKIEKVEDTVKGMKDIFITPVKDWQQNIVDMVRKISLNSEYDYKDLWSILYDELETTAKCSLNRLVANKKARMEKAGNTKAAIEAGTKKIAIIAEKPQLRVIFEGIVKRYAMKYIA